jgi:hypothetical protein
MRRRCSGTHDGAASDPEVIEHDHPGLALDDPDLEGTPTKREAHVFAIDDYHQRWPNRV